MRTAAALLIFAGILSAQSASSGFTVTEQNPSSPVGPAPVALPLVINSDAWRMWYSLLLPYFPTDPIEAAVLATLIVTGHI